MSGWIITEFGQNWTYIDPSELIEWIESNGYKITFKEAQSLDEQYAHWNCDDKYECGTHWLAAFNFPKVGDVVEIESTKYKTKWTGILTMAIEPVQ